jgi:hypothetical protein
MRSKSLIPCPPKGYYSWHSVPIELKNKYLKVYRAAVEPIYKNPKWTEETIFVDMLYEYGIFNFPPEKQKLIYKILDFFRVL